MYELLNLEDYDKIKGEIYKITNTKNGLIYIGQTKTHRKNKNKYRFFGYEGRFKDHISEAINNTKKNQCKYLNNAIRIDKDFFIVELIETCDVKDLDSREIFYITSFNSYYPSGYNLTRGGKTTQCKKIESNSELQNKQKRGREYGYKHSEETKEKMKKTLKSISSHLKDKASSVEHKNDVSRNIIKYYDERKIKKLSEFELDRNIETYIKPVYKNKEICSYKIYLDRKNVFKACSKLEPPSLIYERLKNILLKAKELKSKNCQDIPKG